jgi:hypothetical protein
MGGKGTGRALVVAIVALYCRLAGSLAPIAARCFATGQRTPGVRMEEHEGKRVHAARWQQYAAGSFTPPAPLGHARDSPSPDAQGMLPPALRAWVERSFAQCTKDDEHSIVEREFLQRVAQGGLDQVDWDAEPLIDMRAASPSGSEAPWRRPTPDAVPMHTGGGRARQAEAAGAAEREMLTDETLAARLQPRMSHKEQMARLAEAAHAAEVEALAARVTPRSIYAQQRELQAEVARAPPRLQPRRASPGPRSQHRELQAEVARAADTLAQSRAAAESRAAESRAAESRAAESRAAESRAAESRAAHAAEARLQPRMSHRKQMALLAEEAHAAEAKALAARRLEVDGASAVAVARQVVGRARDAEQAASLIRAREVEARLAARTAGAGRRDAPPPSGRRAAPAPTSVSSTGHSIRIRDRREMKP